MQGFVQSNCEAPSPISETCKLRSVARHCTCHTCFTSRHKTLDHNMPWLKPWHKPRRRHLLGLVADGVPDGVQLPPHDVVEAAEQAVLQLQVAGVDLVACPQLLKGTAS